MVDDPAAPGAGAVTVDTETAGPTSTTTTAVAGDQGGATTTTTAPTATGATTTTASVAAGSTTTETGAVTHHWEWQVTDWIALLAMLGLLLDIWLAWYFTHVAIGTPATGPTPASPVADAMAQIIVKGNDFFIFIVTGVMASRFTQMHSSNRTVTTTNPTPPNSLSG